ncbi:MAG: hypothetical protein LBM70_09995 [Victivallales bacterium]|jgi:hypothetical protein|nr:hypothetical protein [Victivallales bacterium]
MKLPRFLIGCFALITLAVLAGCTIPRLPDGKYSSTAREDFILVSNDLIFLHITTPQENPDPYAYWNWAGKYSLSKDGHIVPDMETELLKNWNFYYRFFYEKGVIKVIDTRESKSLMSLILEHPLRRK